MMAISQLIEQTIAQHIANPRVISYAGTKKDVVQGRFVASNRVYNFVLTRKGVSYSPAGRQDSLVFSALFLERLDAARRPKIGNDKCNAGKSYQCGKICLGNRRKCHKGVKDVNDARRIASILASTNSSLFNKVAETVSDRALVMGNRLTKARENRVANPKPERVKVTAKPVKKLSDIPNIPESAKPWVKSVENLVTPELVAIAQKVGIPEITKEKGNSGAFYRSLDNIVGMGDHKIEKSRDRNVFLHEYGHYIDFNLGQEGRKIPISASEEGVKARKLDEKIIKSTEPKPIYQSIKIDNDKSILKAIEESQKLLVRDFRPDLVDSQGLKTIYETSKDLVWESVKKGLKMTLAERATFKQALYNIETYSTKDVTNSPLEEARQTNSSVSLLVFDLFGAITKNKIGRGHSDNYYKKNKYGQGTEAFANIIAIANSGDEKAIAVAKKFAPNMWKFVMDSIKV